MIRRAALAGLVIALALPSAASAHALLEGTSPPRGATVKTEPGQIEFRFNEPVESAFGAVRVFDPKGTRVDTGAVLRPHGQKTVGVKLRGGLPNGSYTATYHVISADSHPVSGGFVFSIGSGGPPPSESVSQLTQDQQAGKVTEVAAGVNRGLEYTAIALVVGGLAFALLVWLPALSATASGSPEWRAASEAFAVRFRRIIVIGLILGIVCTALGIVFQGAVASGVSFWDGFKTDLIRDVLKTRFGAIWGMRLIDWLLIAAAVFTVARVSGGVALKQASVGATGLAPSRPAPPLLVLLALPLAFLVLSPALAGHASSQSPSGLLIPTDFIHVSAMSVWIGGLVLLALALPAATRALPVADRTRLLAATLLRFSPLALGAVIALTLTGTIQAIVHVGHFGHLLDTPFGRAVLIKIGLLLVLIGLGFYNRNRALPALKRAAEHGESPGEAGRGIRRSLRAEIAILVAVIGVTSALVSYAPASGASPKGPFAATKTTGPLQLQLTVDPARVGANTMHLYLLDAKTGTPYNGTKELTVSATLPSKQVGPIQLTARHAGPGHFVMDSALLSPGGKWDVKLVDRVSAFDEYTTDFKVPIR